jgi:hypothetical protein
MNALDTALKRLQETAANPRKALDGYLSQGRKAVGWACSPHEALFFYLFPFCLIKQHGPET